MGGFPKHLYGSYLTVHGPSLTLVGLALAILPFFVTTSSTVPVKYVVASSVVLAVLIFVLFHAAYSAWSQSKASLPAIIRTLDPPAIYANVQRLLLAEPSELFSTESMISIYLQQDGFERLVGVGRVLAVQLDRHLQVGISVLEDAPSEVIENLQQNDAKFLRKLILKPSIPSTVYMRQ